MYFLLRIRKGFLAPSKVYLLAYYFTLYEKICSLRNSWRKYTYKAQPQNSVLLSSELSALRHPPLPPIISSLGSGQKT